MQRALVYEQRGHWCFLGPRQKIRGGMELPTNLNENEILSHCNFLTHFKCRTFSRDISSNRAIIACTVEERRRKYNFQSTFNKKFLIKTMFTIN